MKPTHSLLLLSLVASAGCGGAATGDGSSTTQPETTTTFIALQRDFQSFSTWEHFHMDGDGSGTPHFGVNRDVYLNHRPPKGATSFPVGTIIVKHTDGVGDPDNGGPRTFAMVKRGGDYNKQGALNWEWFELIQDDPTNPASPWLISWRGLGPPAGGGYGSTGAECNGCHAQAQGNDFVPSDPMLLSNLAR